MATSQCTYRCVVLPDMELPFDKMSQMGLNAPTGAWCSPTKGVSSFLLPQLASQCTYRCVVLPDRRRDHHEGGDSSVSMHLQVRGAP